MVLSTDQIKKETEADGGGRCNNVLMTRPGSSDTPQITERDVRETGMAVPKTEVRDAGNNNNHNNNNAPCGFGTEANYSPVTLNDSREHFPQRVPDHSVPSLEEPATTRPEPTSETSSCGGHARCHEDAEPSGAVKHCQAFGSRKENGPSCHRETAPRTERRGGGTCESAHRPLTNFSIDQILRADFGKSSSRSSSSNISSNSYHGNDVRRFPSLVSPLPASAAPSTLLFPAPVPNISSSLRRLSSSLLSAFSSVPPSSVLSQKQPTTKQAAAPERYFNPCILTPPPSSPESPSSLSPPSSSSSSSSTPSRHRVLSASPKKETPPAPLAAGLTSAATPPRSKPEELNPAKSNKQLQWPAWVYCTRYSDRPSSGPRYRKPRQNQGKSTDKRPRTAFSTAQLQKLRTEFHDCPYLSESRRISLARELGLSESQVKIWFQNKRAKLKKGCGVRNPLAQLLMEEGLYNHSTIVVKDGDNDSNSGCSKSVANN